MGDKLTMKPMRIKKCRKLKPLSPSEARSIDELCSMRSDNFGTGTHWILTDSLKVTIAAQVPGNNATQMMSVDRQTFNKLIHWYVRKQARYSRRRS